MMFREGGQVERAGRFTFNHVSLEGIVCRFFIILSKAFGVQRVPSLLSDDSYSTFYGMGDYPVAKYLQEPLYFEVELMRSTNAEVSLELENCWATLDTDRMSQPRWNLVING